MIGYVIILAPIALIIAGVGLYQLAKTVYGAIYDALAYFKERKELKWM